MNPRLHNWAMTVANSVKASIEEPAKSGRTSADLVSQFAALNPQELTRTDEFDPRDEIDIFSADVIGRWSRGEF